MKRGEINFPGWRKGYNKKPTPRVTLIYGFAVISALVAPIRKVYLPSFHGGRTP